MACWKWTSCRNLVPSLAKDWTVSKDGLTYTYKLRKGSNGWLLKGKEYGGEVKPRLSWQVSNTRQMRNHKRFTWSKNLSKVWMIMFQGRHLISQLLVWKLLTITPFNIPWANQKVSGIPRLRWGSWCRSMKNSWNLKGMTMVKELLHLVSSTAVLIWSNLSLLNLLRYWKRTQHTGMRIMLRSVKSSWPIMMDKTQNPWFVGLITATIQLPVFSQNGSNYKSVEKKHKGRHCLYWPRFLYLQSFLQHWPSGLWNHKEDHGCSKDFN